MAVLTTSTPPLADKAPASFMHTRISSLFSTLIVTLSAFIEAERDIEDVDVWDPAFTNWLRTAELAQTRVTTLIAAIRALKQARPADHPLARMAILLDGMLGAETRSDFRHYQRLLIDFAPLFRAPGSDVIAYRVNHMLLSAQRHIEAFGKLDRFADAGGPATSDLGPETAVNGQSPTA